MKMKKIITFIFLQYCLNGLDLENISFQKKMEYSSKQSYKNRVALS